MIVFGGQEQTCRSWGLSDEDFRQTQESNHTIAYTRVRPSVFLFFNTYSSEREREREKLITQAKRDLISVLIDL